MQIGRKTWFEQLRAVFDLKEIAGSELRSEIIPTYALNATPHGFLHRDVLTGVTIEITEADEPYATQVNWSQPNGLRNVANIQAGVPFSLAFMGWNVAAMPGEFVQIIINDLAGTPMKFVFIGQNSILFNPGLVNILFQGWMVLDRPGVLTYAASAADANGGVFFNLFVLPSRFR